jgi:hypothetical protein
VDRSDQLALTVPTASFFYIPIKGFPHTLSLSWIAGS